jgi:hypothetical protein
VLWWSRDAGPTDVDNGVLLCTSCHYRIHDDGWEIRIENGPDKDSPDKDTRDKGTRDNDQRHDHRRDGDRKLGTENDREEGRPPGNAAGGGPNRGRLRTSAKVWFIPPAWLDASRTPRLGGRARYDLVA